MLFITLVPSLTDDESCRRFLCCQKQPGGSESIPRPRKNDHTPIFEKGHDASLKSPFAGAALSR